MSRALSRDRVATVLVGIAAASILTPGAQPGLDRRPSSAPSVAPPSVEVAAPQPAETAHSFANEAAVLAADATDRETRQELEALALDASSPVSSRYVALRRLETQAPAEVVAVALALATSDLETRDAELLRANAIAVLARSTTPAGREALASVRSRTPDAECLVAQLEGRR